MLLASAIDFQTGNEEQAARRLARLVQQQPDNRRARRLLAAAQWRMGDPAGVVATLRPLADRPDADAYSLTLIGRALGRRRRSGQAALYLARAAAPQPARSPRSIRWPTASSPPSGRRPPRARQRPGPGALISALLARGLGEALRPRPPVAGSQAPARRRSICWSAMRSARRGDFAGAAAQYRRAANLAFSEPVALRLIEALRRSDQLDAADDVLALFLQQNPRSVPGRSWSPARMKEREDWAEAIAIYEGSAPPARQQ